MHPSPQLHRAENKPIRKMIKKVLLPAFFCAATLGAHGASIHTGLLNYWPMDGDASDTSGSYAESTGATVDDGSVNGSVSFAAGLTGFGQTAVFPGGGGNNITIADPTAGTDDIDRSGADLTLSFWFQLNNVDTGWQGLVAHGEGTDYRVAVRGTNEPIQYAYAGGGASSDIFSATTFGAQTAGDGLWHHLVATTAGSSTALYIDGNLEAAGGTGPISENGANTLCIGCNPDRGREWNGLLDDVAMWDRALTQTEVTEIFSAGQAGLSLGQIPEPSTGILGALAGLAVCLRRRR